MSVDLIYNQCPSCKVRWPLACEEDDSWPSPCRCGFAGKPLFREEQGDEKLVDKYWSAILNLEYLHTKEDV